MTELRTRKPTGKVAYPLLQIDGEEKAGKSYALAALTGSPRVGRSFLLDLGDGSLDEYASLGDFDLIETNGTFGDVLEQVELACAVPSDPERPNVVGVDAGTLLWGLLKAKAERRARSSKRARDILAADPDADIDVTMTYWNDVKDDWARLLHVLKRFPGIGIVTAQGRWVSKVDANGQPVRGQQEWSTDVEKTTHSWSSAMVRLYRDPREARLVGVRSLHVDIPSGGLLLPRENTLEHLVFEILGAGGFGPTTATAPVLGVPVAQAKARILAAVKRARPNFTDPEAKAAAADLWKAAGLDGKREVTEVELSGAMPVGQEPQKPAGGDEGAGGGGAPSSGSDAPQGGPQAPEGARPETNPPTPADEERARAAAEDTRPIREEDGARCHVLPDGAVLTLEGHPVTVEEGVAYIRGLLKPASVTLAAQVGVSTAGKKEDIQDRILEAWGLLEAPFDAPAPPSSRGAYEAETGREQERGDDGPQDPPEDDLPEVEDIPDGWAETTCALCASPMMYEKGNYTKTKRHLEAALDDDHGAEEGF